MVERSILITGATGKIGQIVVRSLLALGKPVRVFTRRTEVASALFGKDVEIARGDFGDIASLDRAFANVHRVLLLSPIDACLIEHQTAVIDAAVRNGARRVIKISGSDWTISEHGRSMAGDAHAAVERHLAASGLEWAALRPNAWMQVSLARHIADILAHASLAIVYGDAPVGYIDARDIADVAINQLLAARCEGRALILTGGDALAGRDLARIFARLIHRSVAVTHASATHDDVPLTFEQRAVREFIELIREGRAAQITDTVPRLLGRAPRTVEAFLAEHLEAVAA